MTSLDELIILNKKLIDVYDSIDVHVNGATEFICAYCSVELPCPTLMGKTDEINTRIGAIRFFISEHERKK